MKSLKALKNRSAGARGIKASALAALGASVLLIGAMLSACGSSGETKVDAPKLDDAGAREVLTALLPDAEELTEVIWGDGLPVDDEELLESVSGAQYRPISADSAYKSEEQIKEKAETVSRTRHPLDYKTALQEIVQKNREETLTYRLKGESGPDHDKRFLIELLINSNVIAQGEGRSKKEAEQEAARQALELMGQ